MLDYPFFTTRTEKLEMIHVLKNRLLSVHGDKLLAIGCYGSIALGKDEPYSDIEIHVITKELIHMKTPEFVYGKFKIEISLAEKEQFLEKAKAISASWAIKAGSFIHVLPVYDPSNLFEDIKTLPFASLNTSRERVMKEFIAWEPYETIAKIRNNYRNGNLDYLPIGASDLLWQTAKLIGLANKKYYSTRARTLEESVEMASIPFGYKELMLGMVAGQMADKEKTYRLCENLWSGLNERFAEMGLDYQLTELPF